MIDLQDLKVEVWPPRRVTKTELLIDRCVSQLHCSDPGEIVKMSMTREEMQHLLNVLRAMKQLRDVITEDK